MFLETIVQAKNRLTNIKNVIQPFERKKEIFGKKTQCDDKQFNLASSNSEIYPYDRKVNKIEKSIQTNEGCVSNIDHFRESHEKQINWMTKIIDELKDDNLILQQNLEDSKKVIELIVSKIKQLKYIQQELIFVSDLKTRNDIIIHQQKV